MLLQPHHRTLSCHLTTEWWFSPHLSLLPSALPVIATEDEALFWIFGRFGILRYHSWGRFQSRTMTPVVVLIKAINLDLKRFSTANLLAIELEEMTHGKENQVTQTATNRLSACTQQALPRIVWWNLDRSSNVEHQTMEYQVSVPWSGRNSLQRLPTAAPQRDMIQKKMCRTSGPLSISWNDSWRIWEAKIFADIFNFSNIWKQFHFELATENCISGLVGHIHRALFHQHFLYCCPSKSRWNRCWRWNPQWEKSDSVLCYRYQTVTTYSNHKKFLNSFKTKGLSLSMGFCKPVSCGAPESIVVCNPKHPLQRSRSCDILVEIGLLNQPLDSESKNLWATECNHLGAATVYTVVSCNGISRPLYTLREFGTYFLIEHLHMKAIHSACFLVSSQDCTILESDFWSF